MKCLISIILAMVWAAALTGCTAAPTNLHHTGYVQVEQTTEGKVRISGLGIHEKDGGVEVCGTLKRRDRSAVAIKAHVDITVRTPEGKILTQARSQSQYITRRRIGTGSKFHRRFTVFLEGSLPKGSVVQVVVHSQEHDSEQSQ